LSPAITGKPVVIIHTVREFKAFGILIISINNKQVKPVNYIYFQDLYSCINSTQLIIVVF